MSHHNGVLSVNNTEVNLTNKILNGHHNDKIMSFEDEYSEIINKNNASNGKAHYQCLEEYMMDVAKKLDQRRSFYTLDFADVILKIQRWKSLMPRVEIYYATKANSDPLLLKLFVLMGLSFDCATEGEIQMILDAGGSPGQILWAHTVKPLEGLKYARVMGVEWMTVDSLDELDKIHRVFPEAKLLLRIQPLDVHCEFDLSSKFGCPEEEVPTLLKKAQELNMNIEGISFHVGGLCTNPDSFSSTIRECGRIFEAGRKMGFRFSVLDIGGGFRGAFNTEGIFIQMTKAINRSLEDHFPVSSGVRIIAEPGCYVVGSAMHLVCTVIGKRTVYTEGRSIRNYFLNNSIYGSFFNGVDNYGIRVKPLMEQSEIRSRSKNEAILFGQTCSPADVIQKGKYHVLPDLNVGEYLVWENIGAYSNVLCSTFCGVPLPDISYVFVDKSSELNTDGINNWNATKIFIKKNATYIGSKEDF